MEGMKRIEISSAVRAKASVVDPDSIVCVHPRDLIRLIDIVNVLVDDYRMRHGEISHQALLSVAGRRLSMQLPFEERHGFTLMELAHWVKTYTPSRSK